MKIDLTQDLFSREKYLSKIRGFYHECELIKVLTGVRRCGKSSIMTLIMRELMKSRRSLSGEKKFYLSDLSFFYALNTDNRINFGPVLENIVYNYARSLDYSVSVGRFGKFECDFIVRGIDMQYAYIQVAYTIALVSFFGSIFSKLFVVVPCVIFIKVGCSSFVNSTAFL